MDRLNVSATCLALGLTVALGACGSDGADPRSDNGPVASFERDPDADGGDAAGIQGVLELVNGCLRVRDDRDDVGTVTYPAFAAGTFRWDAGSQTLTVDGSAITVGDQVLLGGGTGSTDRADVSAPEGCDDDAGFFIVAPDSVGLRPPDDDS